MAAEFFNPDTLREDIDLEAKRAGGRDGRGALPQDLWETYSSFANTDGGLILLGVAEKPVGGLDITGIKDPDSVLNDFWAQINNPQKVSRNLLSSANVRVLPATNARWVIEIEVPRASRKERPVFINGNPLTGTYKRLHTGDFRCREDEVRRMLAEQVEDERDARVLSKFDLADTDQDALTAYRNRFATMNPDHPFNSADDRGFLRSIGGWGTDRETGAQGLTFAGLLMFGRQLSIEEVFPHYFVDYREIPDATSRTTWLDRFKPDGTWSGNLFDFYRTTILRLFRDIKVPFRLNRDQREDETPVHKALREALVNTIIHADYSVNSSIVVFKAPELYEFCNPGRMRIPVNEAFAGGHSDCRNRNLQKMFSFIGLGERAGSGIPRVVENWKSQHYRPPELMENNARDYTLMRLRTVSLLPEAVMALLRRRFGQKFDYLDENGRLTLATAHIEGFVSNVRLQQISRLHPRDITLLLQNMVQQQLLVADGAGRGTTYRVTGGEPVDLGSSAHIAPSSEDKGGSFAHIAPSSKDKGDISAHITPSSEDMALSSEDNRMLLPMKPERDRRLLAVAHPVRSKKRTREAVVRSTILALCKGHFLMLIQIANILQRSPIDLRQRFIKPMLEEGLLERRFPQQPNHEQQAYRTREPA